VRVKVRLVGVLSFNYPAYGKFRSIEIKEGARVKYLRERMGTPVEKVHLVSVNGQMVGEDYQLNEGDEVIFFPAASGG